MLRAISLGATRGGVAATKRAAASASRNATVPLARLSLYARASQQHPSACKSSLLWTQQVRSFGNRTLPSMSALGKGPVRPLDDKDPVDPLKDAGVDTLSAPKENIDFSENVQEIANVVEGADLSWVPYPPTEPAIKLLQLVHDMGLPWCAAIAATTITMRTLMVPVAISAMKNGAKLAQVQPEMKRLQEKMKMAQTEDAKKAYAAELRGFMIKHNVNPLKSMLPIVVQMPLFMTFFFALRRMAEEFPSMQSGGAFWFPDLTIADTTYGLPLLSAATFLITIELGGESGEHQAEQTANMKNVMRAMAVVMVPLTMSFPSAVFCYWVTSNSFSCVQTALFKIPGVKGALGIPSGPLKPIMPAAQDGMPGGIVSAPAFGGVSPTPVPVSSTSSMQGNHISPSPPPTTESSDSGKGESRSDLRRKRRNQRRQKRRKR